MILTKFDPPVKILRVKSGLLEIRRVKESFQGSNGYPDIVLYQLKYQNINTVIKIAYLIVKHQLRRLQSAMTFRCHERPCMTSFTGTDQ
jgi:hypothetical protein